MITLYYAPGACSMNPHIALRESKLPFQLAKVDLRNKKVDNGEDWLAVNPKGYVPAMRLPNGEILTEGAVMVRYIADQAPDSKLAAKHGTTERLRLDELLHFIATELHKSMSPLFTPSANEEFKTQLRERISMRYSLLAGMLQGKPYLTGDDFSVADSYAYWCMSAWTKFLKQDLTRWPDLVAYYDRVGARPAVKEALAAEGLG